MYTTKKFFLRFDNNWKELHFIHINLRDIPFYTSQQAAFNPRWLQVALIFLKFYEHKKMFNKLLKEQQKLFKNNKKFSRTTKKFSTVFENYKKYWKVFKNNKKVFTSAFIIGKKFFGITHREFCGKTYSNTKFVTHEATLYCTGDFRFECNVTSK